MPSIPLYRRIQEEIKAKIANGDLREGDLLPSESELMAQYYVSSITAKNSLNGLVDQGIIYRLKGKGSFVSTSPFAQEKDALAHRNITIGAVFPTLSTRIEQVYLIHLEKICRQHAYLLMVSCSRESPAQEIRMIQNFVQNKAQGLYLFPTVGETSNAVLRQLVAQRFPLVFVDRFLPDIHASYSVSANLDGGKQAAEYILKKHGANISICHFPLINNAVTDRFTGFRLEVERAGYSFASSHQCLIDDTDILLSDNVSRIERLLDKISSHLTDHPDVRGLFAVNVEIAQVSFYAIRRLGFTPGIDFTLISFDNPHLPGVSYIQQDLKTITHRAMVSLSEQIQGKHELIQDHIPTRLVEVSAFPATPQNISPLVTGFTY